MKIKIAIMGFIFLSILIIGCVGNINTQNIGISRIERTEIEIPALTIPEVEARIRRTPRDGYGICTRVVDGDTIELTGFGRIRLAGVNTPERGQAGFREATEFTRRMVLNRRVFVNVDERRPRDRHGRVRAVIIVNGVNLNNEIVRMRHARRF